MIQPIIISCSLDTRHLVTNEEIIKYSNEIEQSILKTLEGYDVKVFIMPGDKTELKVINPIIITNDELVLQYKQVFSALGQKLGIENEVQYQYKHAYKILKGETVKIEGIPLTLEHDIIVSTNTEVDKLSINTSYTLQKIN